VAKTLRELQKFFDLRPLRDLDGMYRLIATPRHEYGQAFWFSAYRFLRSPIGSVSSKMGNFMLPILLLAVMIHG
jgi:hypothetical protein